MGLRSWIRGRRKPSPRRPWVRPEFLGLFALLVVSGGAVSLWAWSAGPGDNEAPAATQKEDYVGYTPAEAIACQPACNVDGLLYLWKLEHPEARIIEQRPMYYQGVLIGYELVYRE